MLLVKEWDEGGNAIKIDDFNFDRKRYRKTCKKKANKEGLLTRQGCKHLWLHNICLVVDNISTIF